MGICRIGVRIARVCGEVGAVFIFYGVLFDALSPVSNEFVAQRACVVKAG